MILKNKSGASLIFVLSLALLLMAIAVSVLVAASNSAGSVNNTHVQSKLEIYTDSVVKSFTHSLRENDIGDEILEKIYKIIVDKSAAGTVVDKTIKANDIGEMKISYDLDDEFKLADNKEFTLSFSDVTFDKIDKTEIPVDVPVNVPSITTINDFNLTLTITTKTDTETTIKKQAIYKCSGAIITFEATDKNEKNPMYEHGEWRMVQYGKVS